MAEHVSEPIHAPTLNPVAEHMYRIAWKCRRTNYASHGQYCLTYEQATEYANFYNGENLHIEHWPEQQLVNDDPL